jgi:Na+-driven multidrug efflux pump
MTRQNITILLRKINQINLSNIWNDIKDSLGGSSRDYTKIRLSRAVFLLAIPMVLEMVMESIFAVVDIYFVNKISTKKIVLKM